MSVRGLTLFSRAASPTFFHFFLFFPVFTLHRKGEDNKEADGEKEGEGGQGWKTRKSNSNLLALRYRELARLRVISAILDMES